MTAEHTDALTHNGVKGMRWGVRKDAKAGVKRFAKQAQPRLQYVNREITEQEYKSLSASPIRVTKSGETLARVVYDNKATLGNDFAYATKHDDKNSYVALLNSKGLPGNPRNEARYELSISTSKAVVSPGLKERVDTFVSTLGDQIPSEGSVRTGRAYLFGDHEDVATRALSNQQLGLKYYQTFVQSQHARDPLTSAYINRIKKRGYTALVDDADREFMAKLPVMLFPKESGAQIVEVKPLTKVDALEAKARLQVPD